MAKHTSGAGEQRDRGVANPIAPVAPERAIAFVAMRKADRPATRALGALARLTDPANRLSAQMPGLPAKRGARRANLGVGSALVLAESGARGASCSIPECLSNVAYRELLPAGALDVRR
jgi:hypothetical protein